MSCLLLELNDIGIGAALDGELLSTEPGYALRNGQQLTLGGEALARARVNPQSVTNRYWDTLDQDTLPDEGRWREPPAELAYAQLAQIWERHAGDAERALIVVPACFTRSQLGLILGMCRKAGIPVVNLVDAAIATLARPPAGSHTVFLDLTLHRVIGSRCTLDVDLLRDTSSEIDQLGLSSFMSKWAAAVADACVRATRYDPMHSAESEQQLYDALPALLKELSGADSVTYSVTVNDEELRVDIPRSAFVQSVKPFYGRIVGLVEELAEGVGANLNIVLSSRFADFPGLEDELADVRDWSVTSSPEGAALLGATAGLETFAQPGDSVGLIIERPVTVAAEPQTAHRETPQPTHILVDGQAFVLAAQEFVVGTATRDGSWGYRASGAVRGVSRRHCSICQDGDRVVVRDHSTYGTYVNGQKIDSEQRLGAGDVVRVGNPGIELRLVREVHCDG